MSRRLRIGVSARIQYGDAAKPGYLKKNLYYLEQSFARWLQSAGALVYLVPDVVDRNAKGPAGALTLADYAAELDGLVLQGGTDLAPQSYGEQPLRPEWAGDPERDRYEFELLKRFLDLKKPVLGVCRGQQVINVALGGSLYQDTATQKPGALTHQDAAIYDENYHQIEFVPGSATGALYPGVTRAKVNTLHHQAINRLAPGRSTSSACSGIRNFSTDATTASWMPGPCCRSFSMQRDGSAQDSQSRRRFAGR